MAVPDSFLDLIEALLSKPLFRVLMDAQLSSWKGQTVGVRQGCTLSPLLFISVLSVITRITGDRTLAECPLSITP
eukprot:7667313-Alexandrium_andersonii.AAC.1